MTKPTDPLIASRGIRRRMVSIEAAAIAGIVCAIVWSLASRGLLNAALGASNAEVSEYDADSSNGTT